MKNITTNQLNPILTMKFEIIDTKYINSHYDDMKIEFTFNTTDKLTIHYSVMRVNSYNSNRPPSRSSMENLKVSLNDNGIASSLDDFKEKHNLDYKKYCFELYEQHYEDRIVELQIEKFDNYTCLCKFEDLYLNKYSLVVENNELTLLYKDRYSDKYEDHPKYLDGLINIDYSNCTIKEPLNSKITSNDVIKYLQLLYGDAFQNYEGLKNMLHSSQKKQLVSNTIISTGDKERFALLNSKYPKGVVKTNLTKPEIIEYLKDKGGNFKFIKMKNFDLNRNYSLDLVPTITDEQVQSRKSNKNDFSIGM